MHALILVPLALTLVVSAPAPVGPSSFAFASESALRQAPDISIKGAFPVQKLAKGRTTRATVTMSIPSGYHANANKVLESYLQPTMLSLSGPAGVKLGAISYPRGVLRKFEFAQGKPMSVYEGKVVMNFSVTVPANYSGSSVEVRAKVRVQACDAHTCYPPRPLETVLKLEVAG